MNKVIRRNTALIRDAQDGLAKPQKSLPAKWFYDNAGSALFEKITELPEYYPTRTEIQILQDNAVRLTGAVPDGAALVELGSGASVKTRLLLDQMKNLGAYVPIDISAAFLMESAAKIADDYAGLAVTPIAGDFLSSPDFPEAIWQLDKVGFFPGSTIGNLEPLTAVKLLTQVRAWPNVKGFIVGLDLVKDTDRLIAAYDDCSGVTAAFNKNILERLNREAAANIDLGLFAHVARWNADQSRIEMHLVAAEAVTFAIDGHSFEMAKGESIHTENSHKYTQDSFAQMASAGGWTVNDFLIDAQNDFAVALLGPK